MSVRISCGLIEGEERFEADVARPVDAKVLDIPEALATMEAQIVQPDIVGWGATAAILLAMTVKARQMLVTPGKQDLQHGMEGRQRGLAGHQHPTPDERTDAAQEEPQLIDAERWR
jgi:hypothetical protein